MRLYSYFLIGLSVFGVFGSFTYYLPELFPTRLRATGAGFCYNIGRVIAAVGPFMVGRSEEHTSELQSLMRISYAVFCLKKKKKHCHKNRQDKLIHTSNQQQHTT